MDRDPEPPIKFGSLLVTFTPQIFFSRKLSGALNFCAYPRNCRGP